MRKMSLCLAALLLVGVLAGCSGSSDTLTMATESGFRPYEYRDDADNSKIVGVDVDIAEEIAKEMGKTLVIQDMDFDAVIPAVKSGKADFGAAGISITEERMKEVDFTITYATSMQVILTWADGDIQSPDDLEGKQIGVQQGTVADIALSDEDDFPNVSLNRYVKYFDALSDLTNGRIDCIVLDYMPAQELLKISDDMVVLDEELFTDEYAMCVNKGNDELLAAMNTVMQRLLDEGKIESYTMEHLAD